MKGRGLGGHFGGQLGGQGWPPRQSVAN